jgi:C_GCAxxG_C_C family probable redox protein
MDDTFFDMIQLRAKGFCCAQIILLLALKAQGRSNPDLVRSVGGLCYGIGASGELCGALTGGACLISLYTGKGTDDELPDDRHMLMMYELADWFKQAAGSEYGGMRCDEILEKSPDRSVCSRIMADTYAKCIDILVSNGFDPATARKGTM